MKDYQKYVTMGFVKQAAVLPSTKEMLSMHKAFSGNSSLMDKLRSAKYLGKQGLKSLGKSKKKETTKEKILNFIPKLLAQQAKKKAAESLKEGYYRAVMGFDPDFVEKSVRPSELD